MKKFFSAIFAVISLLLGVCSCKSVKPEFHFDLSITGDVYDAPTSIDGDFAVNVCNDNTIIEAINLKNAPVKSILEQEGVEANDWLDDYIKKNVLSYFSTNTTYDVYVKGYVKEMLTGLTFSVDKRFTNEPE